MTGGTWWMLVPMVAAAYCVVQAVRDFRRSARLSAIVGIAVAIALLFLPVEGARMSVTIPIDTLR